MAQVFWTALSAGLSVRRRRRLLSGPAQYGGPPCLARLRRLGAGLVRDRLGGLEQGRSERRRRPSAIDDPKPVADLLGSHAADTPPVGAPERTRFRHRLSGDFLPMLDPQPARGRTLAVLALLAAVLGRRPALTSRPVARKTAALAMYRVLRRPCRRRGAVRCFRPVLSRVSWRSLAPPAPSQPVWSSSSSRPCR